MPTWNANAEKRADVDDNRSEMVVVIDDDNNDCGEKDGYSGGGSFLW